MGKIEIDIPKDVETRIGEMFPGEDTANAVLRLVRDRLGLAEVDNAETIERRARLAKALEALDRFRASGRTYTDDEIREARQVGRP